MSVQKFRPGKLKHEQKLIPWTQILNKVLSEYTCARALGVWCYLQSKPEDWQISAKNIANHFEDIGVEQAYKMFKELRRVNLMKRIDYKKPDGTHVETVYVILSGEKFDKDGQIYDEDGNERNVERLIVEQSYPQEPLSDFQDSDYQNSENRDYTKERDIQNKVKKQNKEWVTTPNVYTHYPKSFFPDDKRRELLSRTATKVKASETELLQKFEDIYTGKYSTKKSKDWQQTFEEYLNRELPKKVYEDKQGTVRRYDGQSLYN